MPEPSGEGASEGLYPLQNMVWHSSLVWLSEVITHHPVTMDSSLSLPLQLGLCHHLSIPTR